jgi:hypothetical protein
MDSQVKLILEAVKNGIPSPAERVAAIRRAGLLAEAYACADTEMIEEVFGSRTSAGAPELYGS